MNMSASEPPPKGNQCIANRNIAFFCVWSSKTGERRRTAVGSLLMKVLTSLWCLSDFAKTRRKFSRFSCADRSQQLNV